MLSSNEYLPVDVLLTFGRYQFFQLVFSFISLLTSSAQNHYLRILVNNRAPRFFCDADYMDKPSDCPANRRCVYVRFVSNRKTYESRYNMVCGDHYKAAIAKAIYVVGTLVGAIFYGYLADRKGWRKVSFYCGLHILSFGVIRAISPNYWMFVIFRFLSAIGIAGAGQVALVYCTGIVTSKKSVLLYSLCILAAPCGCLLVLLFRRIMHEVDEKVFEVILTATSISGITIYLYCYESPMWLLSIGETAKAVSVFQNIALINRNELQIQQVSQLGTATHIQRSKEGIFMPMYLAFRNEPSIRRVSVIILLVLIMNGIIHTLSQNYLDEYKNGKTLPFATATELIASTSGFQIALELGFLPVMVVYSRLRVIIVLLVINGVLSIFGVAFVAVPYLQAGALAVAIVQSSLSQFTLMVVKLYLLEICPTTHRNIVFGICEVIYNLSCLLSMGDEGGVLSIVREAFPPSLFLFNMILSIAIILLMCYAPEWKLRRWPDSFDETTLIIDKQYFYRDMFESTQKPRVEVNTIS